MNTLTKIGILAGAAYLVSKYAAGQVTNRLGISFGRVVLDKKASLADYLQGLPGKLILNVSNQNDFDISIVRVDAWLWYGGDRIVDISTGTTSVLKSTSSSGQLVFGFKIPFSETLRWITKMFENSCYYRVMRVRGSITVKSLGTVFTVPIEIPLTCE